MDKNKMQQDIESLNMNRKMNEEVLEISSTGYGLESVSKERTEDISNENSCGGL